MCFMIDLSEEISARINKEYTVSEISAEIKRTVEDKFGFVRVKGEIFGAKRADSGHWYLSLKDENAQLSAVCWRGVASVLPIKIEDGLEVIASGKITTFGGRSSYQLVIEHLEPAGIGALLKLLNERKQKFLAEGLFATEHKKKIPYLPNVIGVVTSPTGAVIRDIIHRIRDRFPTRIIVWPTLVQGEGAAEKIAAAIRGFNNIPKSSPDRPDVLIVARGGGSLEDLWPFNEEIVVRAVYDSEIPLISAVGHETDTMLIDYAADVRAPTPTGAAEFAVPVKSELYSTLLTTDLRLKNTINRHLTEGKQHLNSLARAILPLDRLLAEYIQRLDERSERLNLAFTNVVRERFNALKLAQLRPSYLTNIFQNKKDALQNLAFRLDSVSPDSVLRRGFAWVKNEDGRTIYGINQAKTAKRLKIRFADGEFETSLAPKNKPTSAVQGDLFGDLFNN